MKMIWRLLLIMALLFSTAVVAWAEDDESSIFGDDEMTVEITDSTSENESKLLDEKLKIGGDFSFGLTSQWFYGDDWELAREMMGSDLIGRLYFDARPDEDSRYFGKIWVTYPFVISTNLPNTDTADPNDRIIIDTVQLQVQELFSDFNYEDKIFFRAGKHTIKWGVGYFFSPADVLNLTPIDPNDPDAEREGPVSFKIHYPFGNNNFYGYLIANNPKKPSDLAIALKGEYLLGNLELGVGGFYQPELAPRVVLMGTLPTKTLDFFGELVLSYGSDKTFIEKTDDLVTYPFGVKTVQKKDELFPSFTIGFNAITDRFAVVCQYLFNGEGYLDQSLLQEHYLDIHMLEIGLIATGQLRTSDVTLTGRHYGAFSASFSKLFNNSDLSVSLFWLENFSDYSQMLTPKFSWKMLDKATLSISAPCFFGEPGTEFAPLGIMKSLMIGVTFGNGSF